MNNKDRIILAVNAFAQSPNCNKESPTSFYKSYMKRKYSVIKAKKNAMDSGAPINKNKLRAHIELYTIFKDNHKLALDVITQRLKTDGESVVGCDEVVVITREEYEKLQNKNSP